MGISHSFYLFIFICFFLLRLECVKKKKKKKRERERKRERKKEEEKRAVFCEHVIDLLFLAFAHGGGFVCWFCCFCVTGLFVCFVVVVAV